MWSPFCWFRCNKPWSTDPSVLGAPATVAGSIRGRSCTKECEDERTATGMESHPLCSTLRGSHFSFLFVRSGIAAQITTLSLHKTNLHSCRSFWGLCLLLARKKEKRGVWGQCPQLSKFKVPNLSSWMGELLLGSGAWLVTKGPWLWQRILVADTREPNTSEQNISM